MIGAETYWSILSNPAHIGAEITWDILLDVVAALIFWPIFRWGIRRHDRIKHPNGET